MPGKVKYTLYAKYGNVKKFLHRQKKAACDRLLFPKEKVFLWGLQFKLHFEGCINCNVKILGVFTVVIIAEYNR